MSNSIDVRGTIYDNGDEVVEYAQIEQEPRVLGESRSPAFLTIVDEEGDKVVFLVSQIPDILDAINDAVDKWKAAGGSHR
jgi:hypothetical protein